MQSSSRYETMFLWLAGAMLFMFAIATAVSSNGLKLQLPASAGQVAPDKVSETAGFDEPGIHQISAGRYEVYMVASSEGDFEFTPNEIEVPKGSEVTFFIVSSDVIRSFKVFDTTVNVTVVPGQVAEATYTFDESGDYPFYCTEYCGTRHQQMTGVIKVK